VSAHRVFYVLLRKDEMVLLHAYRKRMRKTPPREIEIARRRMWEVLG
jgi:phage-related protein